MKEKHKCLVFKDENKKFSFTYENKISYKKL